MDKAKELLDLQAHIVLQLLINEYILLLILIDIFLLTYMLLF